VGTIYNMPNKMNDEKTSKKLVDFLVKELGSQKATIDFLVNFNRQLRDHLKNLKARSEKEDTKKAIIKIRSLIKNK